jgi:hypothetical protein
MIVSPVIIVGSMEPDVTPAHKIILLNIMAVITPTTAIYDIVSTHCGITIFIVL